MFIHPAGAYQALATIDVTIGAEGQFPGPHLAFLQRFIATPQHHGDFAVNQADKVGVPLKVIRGVKFADLLINGWQRGSRLRRPRCRKIRVEVDLAQTERRKIPDCFWQRRQAEGMVNGIDEDDRKRFTGLPDGFFNNC
jgi:hypothetical protein